MAWSPRPQALKGPSPGPLGQGLRSSNEKSSCPRLPVVAYSDELNKLNRSPAWKVLRNWKINYLSLIRISIFWVFHSLFGYEFRLFGRRRRLFGQEIAYSDNRIAYSDGDSLIRTWNRLFGEPHFRAAKNQWTSQVSFRKYVKSSISLGDARKSTGSLRKPIKIKVFLRKVNENPRASLEHRWKS